MANVEFTKEQYEKLIKLVFLGNWIVNANRLPDDLIKDYSNIEELVLSKSKEFDLDNLVDATTGEFFPSNELELNEELQQYLDEYEAENFWDELIERLSEDKFKKLYTEEKIAKMSEQESFVLRMKIEEEYANEFEENGLSNLSVKNL